MKLNKLNLIVALLGFVSWIISGSEILFKMIVASFLLMILTNDVNRDII